MKLFSQSRINQVCIFVISFSFISLFSADIAVNAQENEMLWDQNPFLIVEKAKTEASTSLILVGAELLDDQMLDDISPALVAPTSVTISLKLITKQKYENSTCFKRCHIKNDFSASDYTEKQWRLLIENNGHAIFNEIPWKNPDMKEIVLSYLLNNAGHSGPLPEGIGVWEKTDKNELTKPLN